MIRINILLIAGLALLTFSNSQVFAANVQDQWTDYDPCGWNVEQKEVKPELNQVIAEDDQWTDYDPCSMNLEEEVLGKEIAAVGEQWSDYDPCGWNVEGETVNLEVATTFIADEKSINPVN